MGIESNLRVLLADDDVPFRVAMSKALKRRGFSVMPLVCGQEAVAAMRGLGTEEKTTVTVLDLRMPDIDGLEVLRRTPDRRSPVIILTGHGSVPDAVEAMRLGAFTFLTKPVDAHDLIPIIMQAAAAESPSETLIGHSRGLTVLREVVRQVGASKEPVLLRGESGVGKKLVARLLHRNGSEPGESLTIVNARTRQSNGFSDLKIDAGGTLYIDELVDLSLSDQTALLEIIESGTITEAQSGRTKLFNGRVVVGSRADLDAAHTSGELISGLYHRIQVLPLEVQALRHRTEDIIPILTHWLNTLGVDEPIFERGAVDALKAHPWPGNVRELVNLARRLALFCSEGRVDSGLVARMLESNPFAHARVVEPPAKTQPVEEISLEILERRHIEALMDHHKNISRVSRILGINRRTLQRKLRCWGLDYHPLDDS